jgi:hypothetical protein
MRKERAFFFFPLSLLFHLFEQAKIWKISGCGSKVETREAASSAQIWSSSGERLNSEEQHQVP